MLKRFRKFLSEKPASQPLDSELDPFAPIFGDDFEVVTTPVKAYEPPPASPEILELVEKFEEQIEGIHDGTYPVWSKFFKTAVKLNDEYFCDHGESTSLADELMSVYELQDVEALYSDAKFLAEVVKNLEEHVHLSCFILNSGNEDNISPKIMTDFVNVLLERESPLDCEECSMNQWWGNPIAYLAVHPHVKEPGLQRIFEAVIDDTYEFGRDIVLCALAQNEKTPVAILKKLAKIDREAHLAKDEQCPFYDEENEKTINIAYLAERTLSEK
jgi:hypothetical protein